MKSRNLNVWVTQKNFSDDIIKNKKGDFYMYRLKEWFLETSAHGYRGHGNCYDNPNFVNGDFITTSHIMRIEVEDEQRQLKLFTKSGSCYILEYADINDLETERTQKVFEDMNVVIDLQRCVALKEERMKEILELINRNELYVIMTDGGQSVTEAYFKKEDGDVVSIPISVHVGMWQDSIIIADYDTGLCDWRIWPSFLHVEPYHWSDHLEAVHIENVGEDFVFKGSTREIVCKAGKVTVIKSEEYTEEGLLSPDAVNGKGLYTKFL